MKQFVFVLLCVLALSHAAPAAPWADAPLDAAHAGALFTQAWTTTRDHFYDPHMRGLNWDEVHARYQSRLSGVHTRGELRSLINAMLDELHTSHTHLYGPDEHMYWVLASVFGTRVERFPRAILTGGRLLEDEPGLFTTVDNGQTFVKAMLEGGPADVAGLRVGDRLVSVNGRPPTFEAWQGRLRSTVQYQRTSGGPVQTATVQLKAVDPQDAFMDATWASRKVFGLDGHQVGYVHVWAFSTHDVVTLENRLLNETFPKCDALLLDLRDGIGGGHFDFFLPWAKGLPTIRFTSRRGQVEEVLPKAPATMVVLVNGGSRSAKEIYAWGFQHEHLGTLVGTRTAGDVRAARAFYLDDGSLLYLAVAEVRVDGADLEGGGVSPDVTVPRPIPWSDGRDPQYQAALDTLRKLLAPTSSRPPSDRAQKRSAAPAPGG